MAKKQRSVSLTFVLLRFAVVMLGCMLLCGLVWMLCFTQLRNAGIIYQGYVSNQQTERILTEDTKNFISPGEDFLPEIRSCAICFLLLNTCGWPCLARGGCSA